MAKSNNYSLKLVSLIVAGHHVTGFMDGTVVTATKNADSLIPHIGGDGLVTMSESADETGTITVTLKRTSPSLQKLLTLANSKKKFAVSLDDKNTPKVKAGGSEAYILKVPDLSAATEVTGVEFSIYVCDYKLK